MQTPLASGHRRTGNPYFPELSLPAPLLMMVSSVRLSKMISTDLSQSA
jgi:hypothetical protein